MSALTAQQWVLIGFVAFYVVCIACAIAMVWAGTTDDRDMANDGGKDA